jgi:triosephosphate isomerase
MTPIQTKVITVVRKHVDNRNRFKVRLEDIAVKVGGNASADDVRQALIELRDDGFFLGSTECDSTSFRGRLPS